MPEPAVHTHGWRITVDGGDLPADVVALLESLVVDDSLHAPDTFELCFRDPDRVALEKGGFAIGKGVQIAVVGGSSPATLLGAEITAVEVDFSESGTVTVVRGTDKSHRLMRGRKTESYKNMTYSDIARKVAQRAGLPVGQVDATSPVHQHVSQANVSDWQFLADLAREVGYEVAVLEGKLDFRKPTLSREAPPAGDFSYGDPLQLTLGTNLVSLTVGVSSASQVSTVKTRGWDFLAKRPVVGQAPAQTVNAETATSPARLAKSFGNSEYLVTDIPFSDSTSADTAAKSVAEQIASGFVELSAVARGHPQYRAGTAISIGLAGPPFDGRYTLTQTRHHYTPEEGYLTDLVVSGRQDRSLHGLATGAVRPAAMTGVVSAIVTDSKDPEKLGRVKLKFPWLSDSYETDWVRTVQPGAGDKRGVWLVPEVNDEVLVAFDHGDMRCPYVIGGLYNGRDRPKQFAASDPVDGATGTVNARGLQSRTGHYLELTDARGKEAIVLCSGDGKFKLEFFQTEKKVNLHATDCAVHIFTGGSPTGSIKIETGGNVEVKAGGNATVEARQNLDLKGLSVKINGQTGVEINGGPRVAVKGGMIQLN